MDSRTRLVLVRHAEVEERYQRVFGGRIDMGLSDNGRQQAQSLCAYLKTFSFKAAYSSPMKRVRQTLERLELSGATKAAVIDGFREIDFGDWTGLSWDEVNERFKVRAHEWLAQLNDGLIPNAESVNGFRARIEGALRSILCDHPGETILVASHGGVIRMMLSILLEIDLPKMAGFEFEYASVTIVHLLPHKSEVQLANFAPWRERP